MSTTTARGSGRTQRTFEPPRQRRPRTAAPGAPRGQARGYVPVPKEAKAKQRIFGLDTSKIHEQGRKFAQAGHDRGALAAKLPVTLIVSAVVIIGLIITMVLSSLGSSQTYQISAARQESQHLLEEIETLNRDLQHINSSSELARRAGELGMVNDPALQAVITVDAAGVQYEQGEARAAEGSALFDINGHRISPAQATSDTEAQAIAGQAPPVPTGTEAELAAIAAAEAVAADAAAAAAAEAEAAAAPVDLETAPPVSTPVD